MNESDQSGFLSEYLQENLESLENSSPGIPTWGEPQVV